MALCNPFLDCNDSLLQVLATSVSLVAESQGPPSLLVLLLQPVIEEPWAESPRHIVTHMLRAVLVEQTACGELHTKQVSLTSILASLARIPLRFPNGYMQAIDMRAQVEGCIMYALVGGQVVRQNDFRGPVHCMQTDTRGRRAGAPHTQRE